MRWLVKRLFFGRITCAMNGEFENCLSSAIAYAWYIWEKGYKGKPTINDEFVKYDKEKFEGINYFIDKERGVLEVARRVSKGEGHVAYVDSYRWDEVMYVSFWEED